MGEGRSRSEPHRFVDPDDSPPVSTGGLFPTFMSETVFLSGSDVTLDGQVSDGAGVDWWRISRAFWNAIAGPYLGDAWGWLTLTGAVAAAVAADAASPGTPNHRPERGVMVAVRNPATYEVGSGKGFYNTTSHILMPGQSVFLGSTADAIYVASWPRNPVTFAPLWDFSSASADWLDMGLLVRRVGLGGGDGRTTVVPG